MNKAIIIGSLNMDLVSTVDQHPKIGETIAGHSLQYHPGGKGANQAIAARRLGARTQLVGCVGNDAFGLQLRNLQEQEGIDISALRMIDGQATGTAMITVAEDSSNCIVVNPGANARCLPEQLKALTITADDIVLAQLEVPAQTVREAFIQARRAGAKTILNPSPVEQFTPGLLPLVDLLVLNEIELSAISGVDISDLSDTQLANAESVIAAMGCETLVTTLGEKGARIVQQGVVDTIETENVCAVDTTGAGDCFTGAIAAALLGGKALAAAAEFGNAAAAISVTRRGAASSTPLLSEIKSVVD